MPTKLPKERPETVNARQLSRWLTGGKLNESDWEIVWNIYRHRFLNTDQLFRLLFTGQKMANCWYRLRKLFKMGIIDRLKLPSERMEARGLEPGRVYTLGSGGRTWVQRTLEMEGSSRQVRQLKTGQAAVGHPLLYHDLVQNEFLLRMVEEAESRGHEATWLGEWEATTAFEWDGRRRLFRPDGALHLASSEGHESSFLIEMDMGGKEHRRTTKKVPMYERYFRSSAWRTQFDKFPAVLVITSTERRRQRLMRSMERAQRDRVLPWLYGSRETLWDSLCGPVWHSQEKQVTIFQSKQE